MSDLLMFSGEFVWLSHVTLTAWIFWNSLRLNKSSAWKISPLCWGPWAWRRGMGAGSSLSSLRCSHRIHPKAVIWEPGLGDPFLWLHCSEFARNVTVCSFCDLMSHGTEPTILIPNPSPFKAACSCPIWGRTLFFFDSSSLCFPGETSEPASEHGFWGPGSEPVSSWAGLFAPSYLGFISACGGTASLQGPQSWGAHGCLASLPFLFSSLSLAFSLDLLSEHLLSDAAGHPFACSLLGISFSTLFSFLASSSVFLFSWVNEFFCVTIPNQFLLLFFQWLTNRSQDDQGWFGSIEVILRTA